MPGLLWNVLASAPSAPNRTAPTTMEGKPNCGTNERDTNRRTKDGHGRGMLGVRSGGDTGCVCFGWKTVHGFNISCIVFDSASHGIVNRTRKTKSATGLEEDTLTTPTAGSASARETNVEAATMVEEAFQTPEVAGLKPMSMKRGLPCVGASEPMLVASMVLANVGLMSAVTQWAGSWSHQLLHCCWRRQDHHRVQAPKSLALTLAKDVGSTISGAWEPMPAASRASATVTEETLMAPPAGLAAPAGSASADASWWGTEPSAGCPPTVFIDNPLETAAMGPPAVEETSEATIGVATRMTAKEALEATPEASGLTCGKLAPAVLAGDAETLRAHSVDCAKGIEWWTHKPWHQP